MTESEEWFVSRFNRGPNDPAPGVYKTWKGGEFIRPLPDSPFWETDIVEYDGKKYLVTHIINRGDKESSFYLSESLGSGQGIANVSEAKIKLVERGNLWKKEHGEPLHFKDAHEEANFYTLLGGYTDVAMSKLNPRWSLQRAVDALRQGSADAVLGGGYVPLNRRGLSLIKFTDREIGDRIRSSQLEMLKEALDNKEVSGNS